ncbi:MAG: glycoside hydrolase family 16 protein [Clostridia bacterium]|nr:glycoside hydrolase family 16 protein [Clostridia bacterium]
MEKMVSKFTGLEYELKFIDDFDGDELNLDNWTVYNQIYNSWEEQANIPENVYVKDGSLFIKGTRDDKVHHAHHDYFEDNESDLIGGSVRSDNKVEFCYGRLEIKAKYPYSYGMWPCFWTMGTDRGWPWGGEIDIAEFVGGVDQWNNYRDDEYSCGLHWADPDTTPEDAWSGKGHLATSIGKLKMSRDLPNVPERTARLNDDWHIYGLEWTKDKMICYFDDVKVGEIDITDPTMRFAFHRNHYIILNFGMGGSWAGTPNEEKGTVFPQYLQIDWVKIWQTTEQ